MHSIKVMTGAGIAMLGTVVANAGFVLIEWGYRLAGDTKAEAKASLRRVIEHAMARMA